jgi:hypothetical protein
MISPAHTTGDDQMMPDDSPVVLEEPASDPAGTTVADDLEPPPSIVWGHPGADTADGAAEEPGDTGTADAEILSLVITPDAESGPADASPAPDPGPAGASPAPDPGPADAFPAASGSISPSAAAPAPARWHEIQAMFVDDPRLAVEQAAGLAGDSAEALIISVRERQHALMSAWQGDDAGTEELRIALQRYRTFWSCLEDFPRES